MIVCRPSQMNIILRALSNVKYAILLMLQGKFDECKHLVQDPLIKTTKTLLLLL